MERDASPHDNGELLLAEGEVDSGQPLTSVHQGAVVLLSLGTLEGAKGRLRVVTVSGPPNLRASRQAPYTGPLPMVVSSPGSQMPAGRTQSGEQGHVSGITHTQCLKGLRYQCFPEEMRSGYELTCLSCWQAFQTAREEH